MATKPRTKKAANPKAAGLVTTIGTLLLSFVKSPLLHAFLTALLGAVSGGAATIYTAKSMIPELSLPSRPRLLPLPKKAEDAIGKIQFGNAGCTATIIGPVHTNDANLTILTAAHCVRVGDRGRMFLKDGRTLDVKCVSRDADSDAAWLTAANPGGNIPYALLAEQLPADGELVWHQGYGIDKPGNRESGVFKGITSNGKQAEFVLSVSPGDSGGGILLDRSSRVISPVCCTTRLAGLGRVFGSTPEAAARIRPTTSEVADEPALIWPVLPVPEGDSPATSYGNWYVPPQR